MTTKGKLAIISDFHLDSNAFSKTDLATFVTLLQDLGITDLHFNGDMSNDFKALTQPFLSELSALSGLAISYNLGNHDMVGLSESEISAADFSVKHFQDTAFLSFNGWYDYSFMPEQQRDIAKIEHFKRNFYFDRKIQRDLPDFQTTELIINKLQEQLLELREVKRLIISTHFVPEKSFIINTRYEKFARFNAYLGSQHFHETFRKFPNVSDVVFGHIHHRFAPKQIDGINYQARALGYPYEWQLVSQFLQAFPQFQTAENWQLRKRYKAIKALPEWQHFRQQHLAEEFRAALTIFEL